MNRFGIWCSVQGSLGYREAWLKHDAARVEFDSYGEALARASSLNKEKMKNPYAIFYYCPRLINEAKHIYTVVIKYMNDSTSEHDFDQYSAVRDFYQHNISYTGDRVRRVEVRMNIENSTRAIWDHSWDAISKLEGLRQ